MDNNISSIINSLHNRETLNEGKEYKSFSDQIKNINDVLEDLYMDLSHYEDGEAEDEDMSYNVLVSFKNDLTRLVRKFEKDMSKFY